MSDHPHHVFHVATERDEAEAAVDRTYNEALVEAIDFIHEGDTSIEARVAELYCDTNLPVSLLCEAYYNDALYAASRASGFASKLVSMRSLIEIPPPCNSCGQAMKPTGRHRGSYKCFKCESLARTAQREVDEAEWNRQIEEHDAEKSAQLQHLKSIPYIQYLRTDHWQFQRKRALGFAKYRCQLCDSGDHLHVHHRTYERRGEEYLRDLLVLCQDCHRKHHDICAADA